MVVSVRTSIPGMLKDVRLMGRRNIGTKLLAKGSISRVVMEA